MPLDGLPRNRALLNLGKLDIQKKTGHYYPNESKKKYPAAIKLYLMKHRNI